MKVVHVVGARPNFMKAASVYAACANRGLQQMIVHTGQHYDRNMSRVFFQELGLPDPDINLKVGSGSHAEQTAKVMLRFEKIVLETRPAWVIVYGDVNSTLAATLVCTKLSTPVAHVEAGLRSFDRLMPEEINRVVTDQLAEILFTPSEDANANLLREGVPKQKIKLVGNVMVDTLIRFLPLAKKLSRNNYPPRYVLVTLHRPSNVDDNAVLTEIMETLISISRKLPVIFPLHPRTQRRIGHLPILKGSDQLRFVSPLSYLEFLSLEEKATAVITDSGGVQEETTFLGVPCLTLRKNTERPVTVALGGNVLIGSDYQRLEKELDSILVGNFSKGQIPPLWDGKTGERVAEILADTA